MAPATDTASTTNKNNGVHPQDLNIVSVIEEMAGRWENLKDE